MPRQQQQQKQEQQQQQHLLLLLLLALALFATGSTSAEHLDRESCTSAVEEWSESQLGEAQELKWQLQEQQEQEGHGAREMPELLFFLHIPRAGGKSYWQCFLYSLLPPQKQCDLSYHKLRSNPTESCRILATHDDYSMMNNLPPGTRTFVTSVFRDPVSRVLSSYEFGAEMAARSIGLDAGSHPDETLFDARKKVRDHYSGMVSTDTRNIWPWSEMSLAMEADLWHRRDFTTVPPDPPELDPLNRDMYDQPHIYIPLKEYIQLPLVHDIIHNNAVFQLAGITNNSILPEATKLRHCVIKFPELGQHVLALAKARVDTLSHIGFTDRLEESMALLAAMVGRSLASQAHEEVEPGWKPRCRDLRPLEKDNPKPTVREFYANCVHQRGILAQQNSATAFRNFGPVTFGRENRKKINQETLKEIRRLNALDLELVEYARKAYNKMLTAYKGQLEDFTKLNLKKDCI